MLTSIIRLLTRNPPTRIGCYALKVVILPGLNGTTVLTQAFCDALPLWAEGVLINYPHALTDYQTTFGWLEEQLPNDDFVIVAESFSGPLAAMVAAKGHPYLRAVVFVATFAKAPRALPAYIYRLARFVPFGSVFLHRLMLPFVMGRWATPDLRVKLTEAMRLTPKQTLVDRLVAVSGVDVRLLLPEISVPTLCLAASHDWLVPRRASRDFGDVQVVTGPHFLLQTKAVVCSDIICQFVQEVVEHP